MRNLPSRSHRNSTTPSGPAALGARGAAGLSRRPLLIAAVLVATFASPVDTAAASAIAAGGKHTCTINGTGTVLCWGRNNAGQLGDGGTTDRFTPDGISSLPSSITAIATGDQHTCARTSTGGLLCWGNDGYGQLGDDAGPFDQSAPVAVSGLSSGVAGFSAGESHTCALTNAGAVLCWGDDGAGQLGDGGTNTRKHTPVAVSGLASGITAIAAGANHTCALTNAGGVLCWGNDLDGQLGDGGTNTNQSTPVAVSGLGSGVTAIAGGRAHTCALTDAGAALCWGNNSDGQLGDNGVNADQPTPVAVSGLSSGIAAIAAGGTHSCAVTSAGAALCWGDDYDGQLGDSSDTTDQSAPVAVSGLATGVAALSAGWNHTCALTNVGAILCWGDNSKGQLGDGGDTDQPTPVPVAGFAPPTPTPAPTPLPSPTPSGLWLAPVSSLRCNSASTLTGGGFTAGSVVKAFIATPSGLQALDPYTPSARTVSSLTWTLPCSVGLGSGFVALQVINTDQGYLGSNTVGTLLLAAIDSGYPSITGVGGVTVAAADPSYAVAHVETVLARGSTVTINGSGFAVPAMVNLFTAAGNAGPLDTLPGSTSTDLLVQIPVDVPTGPGALQVVNPGGSWPVSNAVSVPLVAALSVTSIIDNGTGIAVNSKPAVLNGGTLAVSGTGFSTLSVINFFTVGGTNHCGLSVGGTALCPITLQSDTDFTVQRPASMDGYSGPAFIQVLNPPFVPFSSTGEDPDSAFTLTGP